VETSDIMFAIDSVPAVLTVTIERFVYLHYGLATILTFVGAKLLLRGFDLHILIPPTVW